MLKGKMKNLVLIGLEFKNLEKLKEDKPIKFNLKEIGFNQDIDILLFAAKDENELRKLAKGMIGPDSIIIDYQAPNN
jgi:hypothetical protein